MTLLAPGALLGLALLAIPILIHLFKPRRVRSTPFSSLRWLHLTQQRMSRRIQWHQVALFLLRVGMLSLLVFSLARPLLAPAAGGGSIDRIVCIDVSRSMGRKVEGRPTPLESARTLAASLVRDVLPGDRTALLLAGSKTIVMAPWTTDAELYLPAIESLEPNATAADLDGALELIRSLVAQRRDQALVEICFLTDCPAGGWTAAAIAEFVRQLPTEPPVSLRLVDVALPAPRNGWIAGARRHETERGAALRVDVTSIGESATTRTLHAAGSTGAQSEAIPVTLEPGRVAVVDLPLSAALEQADGRVRLWLEPADELPDDDEYFVALDTADALRVLLVEADAATVSQRPGLHLRTALAALAEAGAGAADATVTVRSPTALAPEDIAKADIILLADVPGLNEAQADAVTRRVRAGAGAVMFLGPGVQAEVYNQRFVQPLAAGDALLPAALGSVVQAQATRDRSAAWGQWNARHPLAAGLVDPLLGDLAATQSRAYFRFANDPPATDDIVATLDDGTPALIARRVGAGRVVVVNASADDRWCDLPRRKSFVPLVDRLMSYLQASGLRRSFATGETVLLALPEGFDGDSATVVTPRGEKQDAAVETAGGRAMLRLDKPNETGFYGVQHAGETLFTFVVQPGRDDSPLRAIDLDTLRAWWTPAKFEVVNPSALEKGSQLADHRIVLEPWLLAAACLVFLAEMLLVHVLCPRHTPATSTSHVHRRGFVAPLRSRGGALQ